MDRGILPLIELSGSPQEIGTQHGTLLKNRIKRTIEYYHGIFKRSESEIFDIAQHFREVIREFNVDYSIEIEAIAAAAEVDPLWIYALNSRTEILTMFVTECTALYFPQVSLLAQNWDWSKSLEKLMVLNRITRNGHTILQVTEPGIIGKIGMNSAGLGVTLNFLHMDTRLKGLPIHITLRHILDSVSISEAIQKLGKYKYGKSSNIIIGNASGEFLNLEFANEQVFETDEGEYFLHTNHFLRDKGLNTDMLKLASSFSRYSRATTMINERSQTVETIKSLLGDKENNELPICRRYIPNEDIGDVGTVTSIIMDLKHGLMHATKGNPFEHDYEQFTL